MHIITNGNPDQQYTKILNTDFDVIEKEVDVIYANLFEPKPSPASFFKNFSKNEKYLYIGDSKVDLDFSRNANISFLHVDKLKKIFS